MNILGIYGGLTLGEHDPSAAIICDGKLIAVCEEERFLRTKSPRGVLPVESIRHCLKEAGLQMSDIDFIAHPGEIFEDLPPRINDYLVHYFGYAPPIKMIHHQLAHLASSFYCSEFKESMCISYDAYGDKVSAAIGIGNKDGIKMIELYDRDNSLGLFYACITSFLGFLVGMDEYKVMGLSAYGKNQIDISKFLKPTPSGYELDMSFFREPHHSQTMYEPMYGKKLVNLLGTSPRLPGGQILDAHADVAFSAQKALEESIISLVEFCYSKYKVKNLCLAGGVALNCLSNMKVLDLPYIDNLFVQPAASDRGIALGCALQCAFENKDLDLEKFKLENAYFGPTYTDEDIQKALKVANVKYTKCEDPAVEAAECIANDKIVAWYQGRSEFGPRALGHRSILADPRNPNIKEIVNLKVKFREAFRPFAPSVLEEDASEIYELDGPKPFMTTTCRTREEWQDKLPGVTHVDGTARVQTVSEAYNDSYYKLIKEFKKRTGVPVVLNTSFNIKGQPIVESPLDAISTFYGTGLDVLFLGPYRIEKN